MLAGFRRLVQVLGAFVPGSVEPGLAGAAALVPGAVLVRPVARRSLRVLLGSQARGRVFWLRRSSRILGQRLGSCWLG